MSNRSKIRAKQDAVRKQSAIAIALSASVLAAPMAMAQSNIAPTGTAYRWAHNVGETSNANRSTAAMLNDGRQDIDVRLGSPEARVAFQAAGVLWPSLKSIARVEFVNGTWDPTQDGAFCAGLKLQYTTDGRAWRNTDWTVSPTYAYNSSSTAGVTYRFNGAALSAVGIRISGKLRCTTNSSYWTNVREVLVYDTQSGDVTPPTIPANLQASPDTDRINLVWSNSSDNVAVNRYEIFRNDILHGESVHAAYADTAVTAGSQYRYKVRAVDGAGNRSPFSTEIALVFQPAPPVAGPVEPGTVGFLGDINTLTVVQGPQNAPAGCSWYALESSLHCRGNVTIDRYLVRGGIDHYGDGTLSVTNSVIEGGPNFRGIWVRRGSGCGVTITDSTLRWRTGAERGPDSNNGAVVDMDGCSITARRNDISGWSVGLQLGTGGTIEANYIHDLYDPSIDPVTGSPRPCRKPDGTDYNHLDGIQFFGGSDYVIARNYIDVGWRSGGCQTAAIFMGNGTVYRPTFTANFLSGGGYTFRSNTASGVVVTDNIFEALPDQYGDYDITPGTISRWSGNRRLDGTPVNYNP